ncbi:helix-turn-helix transcriptional regulator [Saliniramus sp.]|uniref:helix-turn-helix transcriptional regulator n=1 Tax=Saliniramus sp. TaxID=2986772 RepID=UPI002CF34109|nr:LuxR C-terminal-related transcriptional regulator [Saliniramus sp.]HMB09679.1 LuxR C-terminal-related transcriptional regulator [Saliniramus sp.]
MSRRQTVFAGRIIIVSALQLVRECIQAEILRKYALTEIMHAASIEAASTLEPTDKDILIVDAGHSDSHNSMQFLSAAFPGIRIVMLMLDAVANIGIADTVKLPPSLDALLFMIGAACGLRVETGDEPPDPIAPPAEGWGRLTPREREVAAGVLEGKANKVIAAELGLSDNTVKMHLTQIMRKLKVTNRTQVVLLLGGNRPEKKTRDAAPQHLEAHS